MGSLRQQEIARFRQDTLSGKRESHDTLFRVRYGIPADLQIELARFMTARYLPIFRSHRKDLPWIDQVLAGVDEYFTSTDGWLPERPDDFVQGDTAFSQCVFLLADAWERARATDMGRLTAVCGSILIEAVAARAANVWRADEPEMVHAFEIGDREACRGSSPRSSVASQAVTRREWLVVADWLDEHVIGMVPDIPAAEEADCEQSLAAWKDREYLF